MGSLCATMWTVNVGTGQTSPAAMKHVGAHRAYSSAAPASSGASQKYHAGAFAYGGSVSVSFTGIRQARLRAPTDVGGGASAHASAPPLGPHERGLLAPRYVR